MMSVIDMPPKKAIFRTSRLWLLLTLLVVVQQAACLVIPLYTNAEGYVAKLVLDEVPIGSTPQAVQGWITAHQGSVRHYSNAILLDMCGELPEDVGSMTVAHAFIRVSLLKTADCDITFIFDKQDRFIRGRVTENHPGRYDR
jgi:hypothetical protein